MESFGVGVDVGGELFLGPSIRLTFGEILAVFEAAVMAEAHSGLTG